MKVSKKQRKSVVETLSGKLGQKNAEMYEKNIYSTCLKFSLDYSRCSYHILGCLMTLENKEDRQKLLKNIKEGTLDWDMFVYDDIREKLKGKEPPEIEIEQGVFLCRKSECGSNKTKHWQSQTRSGDEGMTTFVYCTVCGTRYRVN